MTSSDDAPSSGMMQRCARPVTPLERSKGERGRDAAPASRGDAVVAEVVHEASRTPNRTDGAGPQAGGGSGSETTNLAEPAPHEQARLTVPLGAGEAIEVWDDCVVAGRWVFPYDDWFGARLIADPRAPLTVNPRLAVALVTHDAAWAAFVPTDEHDAVRAIAAIREVCQRRGIEPIGIDDDVPLPQVPEEASQPPTLLYQWEEPDLPIFTSGESVLVALVHLSVFFFPLGLPLFVWRALGSSVPDVAGQAREAAWFQGLCCAVALPTLAFTLWQLVGSGLQAGSVLGLTALLVLVVVAGIFAGAAARQAMQGRGFSYRDFARVSSGLGRHASN